MDSGASTGSGPKPLLPLLKFVEDIERRVHEIDSDAKAAAIVAENFAPDAFLEANKQPLDLAGFQAFVKQNRAESRFLDFTFSDPVVVPSDPEGAGGTVGFGIKVKAERKSDGQLQTANLVTVFEVTWFEDAEHPQGGKRLITRSFAAVGAFEDDV